jgi:hypothetical protein
MVEPRRMTAPTASLPAAGERSIDWKASLKTAGRAVTAYAIGLLKVLVPTGLWSLLCLVAVAPIVYLNVAPLLGAGKGIGHGGGAFLLMLLLPAVVLLAVFAVLFPAFYWIRANASGLGAALELLLVKERLPIIRWGVGQVMHGIEKVAPGALTGAVRLDARIVRAAYASISEAERVPRLFRKVLLWLFRKVDLPRLLALELEKSATHVDHDELVDRVSALLEEKVAEALQPSHWVLAVSCLVQGGLAAGAWFGVAKLYEVLTR